jgi:hypothetical protein
MSLIGKSRLPCDRMSLYKQLIDQSSGAADLLSEPLWKDFPSLVIAICPNASSQCSTSLWERLTYCKCGLWTETAIRLFYKWQLSSRWLSRSGFGMSIWTLIFGPSLRCSHDAPLLSRFGFSVGSSMNTLPCGETRSLIRLYSQWPWLRLHVLWRHIWLCFGSSCFDSSDPLFSPVFSEIDDR